ncbi:hypothetical protein J6590_100419 [Homalodisca vitripennis]|nr:hypothetical protein J6590_100419 [Homalodisca vitripennis]
MRKDNGHCLSHVIFEEDLFSSVLAFSSGPREDNTCLDLKKYFITGIHLLQQFLSEKAIPVVYYGRFWDKAPETGSRTNRVRPNLGQNC